MYTDCIHLGGMDSYTFTILFASLSSFFVLFCFSRHRAAKKQKLRSHNGDVPSAANDGQQHCHGGQQTDVVIVGAGVAGAALAYSLAKDGRRVLVIERDFSEPNRISGEVLHPGGYLKLIDLGLEDCVDSIDAQRLIGYDFLKDGKSMKLVYPLEKLSPDITGKTFYNGRFIQRMREKAASLPNVHMEQGTVTSLVEKHGVVKGVHYKTRNGEEYDAFAPLTIVCDGCCSNLRRSLCLSEVEVRSHFVGLVLKNCQLPSSSHGLIVVADHLILFYPISSTEVRCLIDVLVGTGKKLPSLADGEMAEYLRTEVAPQVPPEMYEHFVAAVDEGNIRSLANRIMPATCQPTPGALLMGDAFNMRHPFTGGGMTVALSDAVIVRDLLRPVKDLNDSAALCRYLESFHTLRKPVASTVNTLADLFHKIFSASPDEVHQEMRDALFDYLSFGGECSNGPTALLAGLSPRPFRLVAHLIAVAVYAFGRLMLPYPSPKRLWLAVRLVKEAGGTIFPVLKAEGLVQMLVPANIPVYK